MKNVELKKGYTQVCVWPGTIVGESKKTKFEEFMQINFSIRVQYLEEIKTLPDMENGNPVEGTGERNDVFFAIHSEDVHNFVIPRLRSGIMWIEDAIDNYRKLYPSRVSEYDK